MHTNWPLENRADSFRRLAFGNFEVAGGVVNGILFGAVLEVVEVVPCHRLHAVVDETTLGALACTACFEFKIDTADTEHSSRGRLV